MLCNLSPNDSIKVIVCTCLKNICLFCWLHCQCLYFERCHVFVAPDINTRRRSEESIVTTAGSPKTLKTENTRRRRRERQISHIEEQAALTKEINSRFGEKGNTVVNGNSNVDNVHRTITSPLDAGATTTTTHIRNHTRLNRETETDENKNFPAVANQVENSIHSAGPVENSIHSAASIENSIHSAAPVENSIHSRARRSRQNYSSDRNIGIVNNNVKEDSTLTETNTTNCYNNHSNNNSHTTMYSLNSLNSRPPSNQILETLHSNDTVTSSNNGNITMTTSDKGSFNSETELPSSHPPRRRPLLNNLVGENIYGQRSELSSSSSTLVGDCNSVGNISNKITEDTVDNVDSPLETMLRGGGSKDSDSEIGYTGKYGSRRFYPAAGSQSDTTITNNDGGTQGNDNYKSSISQVNLGKDKVSYNNRSSEGDSISLASTVSTLSSIGSLPESRGSGGSKRQSMGSLSDLEHGDLDAKSELENEVNTETGLHDCFVFDKFCKFQI